MSSFSRFTLRWLEGSRHIYIYFLENTGFRGSMAQGTPDVFWKEEGPLNRCHLLCTVRILGLSMAAVGPDTETQGSGAQPNPILFEGPDS